MLRDNCLVNTYFTFTFCYEVSMTVNYLIVINERREILDVESKESGKHLIDELLHFALKYQ